MKKNRNRCCISDWYHFFTCFEVFVLCVVVGCLLVERFSDSNRRKNHVGSDVTVVDDHRVDGVSGGSDPRVYVEVYGCTFSLGEAEIVRGLLSEAGFSLVDDLDLADVVIVLTCVVKQPTEHRLINRIKELARLPGKLLIVGGCMPEAEPWLVRRLAPEASMFGPHHVTDCVDVVRRAISGDRVELLGVRREVKLCLPRSRFSDFTAIVPISQGCLGSCAYCLVRKAMGSLFSYPIESILGEVRASVSQGTREILLTAQDTASYGFDFRNSDYGDCIKKSVVRENNGINLGVLLSRVCEVEGDFFVRVGMMNPDTALPILHELVSALGSCKIYKFVHIPVQSGSDRVLREMGRKYSVGEFFEVIDKFRNVFPDISVATDVIVGFPGESLEDFRETLRLVRILKPDVINISRYGDRPDTPASKRPDKLHPKLIKKRSKELYELCNKLKLEKNSKWIGWKGRVLVNEKRSKEVFVSRNYAYKPIILKENLEGVSLGDFLEVKIVDTSQNYLLGKIINKKK